MYAGFINLEMRPYLGESLLLSNLPSLRGGGYYIASFSGGKATIYWEKLHKIAFQTDVSHIMTMFMTM